MRWFMRSLKSSLEKIRYMYVVFTSTICIGCPKGKIVLEEFSSTNSSLENIDIRTQRDYQVTRSWKWDDRARSQLKMMALQTILE